MSADIVVFPERFIAKPRPVPNEVALQFDMGKWCVAILANGKLAERRIHAGNRDACLEAAQRIAVERGLPFHVPGSAA